MANPFRFGAFLSSRLGPRAASAAFAIGAAISLGAPGIAHAHMQTGQMQTVDPNSAIDADLDQPAPPATPAPQPGWTNEGLEPVATEQGAQGQQQGAEQGTATTTASAGADAGTPVPAAAPGTTYRRDDLIGAAEGVFGRGAEGLGRLIENILRDQGEPNGYIVGREAGGALVVGVRYGSGTLHHRIEGEMPAYWTGPSVGIDAGANAGSTFILVYNLHDTADLYRRFPAGEGAAYLVGGFNASYLRRGDIVLIPIRLGVGARLGVNVGYMRFSRKNRWLPF